MGLLIAIGFLIWCREKNRLPRLNPGHNATHHEASVQGQEASLPEADHQTEFQCSRRPVISGPISERPVISGPISERPVISGPISERPAISGPINDFNSSYDKPDSSCESSGIYNEAADYTEPYSGNPFQGWASSSRPIGPPPPPPPEAIAMVERPVLRINKSTMTLESDYSSTKRSSKASSDFKSGYAASPETSLERTTVSANTLTGARPKRNRAQNKADQAFDEGPPDHELPPLPARSSSLRRKNKRKRRNASTAAATLS